MAKNLFKLLRIDENNIDNYGDVFIIYANKPCHVMEELGVASFRYDECEDTVLFLYPHALDSLHEQFRRTVKDRHLRCIDIDDAVIHAHGVERTQRMLHGAYFPFAVLQYRTAFGGRDIVRQRSVAGLVWQIHAPQAHTRIRRRRVEGSGHVQTRMQTYRTQRKTLFYSMLFQNQ